MSSEAAPRSILLVEDDPLLAATIRRHVERIAGSGSVSTAASVAEGEQAWNRLQADLALVDYRLPDGFGTDLIRKMRAAGSRTRVVCMTAESEAITPEQRAQLQIEETLTKPVAPDLLGRILQDNRVERCAQPPHQSKRIGRFRLIQGRKAISGSRLGRLMQAAENEKWIAFEIVPDHIQDPELMRGLCAWSGWLSSRGGQLCILAGSPENARLVEQAANGLVDTVCTREQLKDKPTHLTSMSERAQLINILRNTRQETTS